MLFLVIPKSYYYFVYFFAAFKLEELVPITEDSEEKIEKFLALYEVERSFRFNQSSLRESSSATDLMSTCKDPQLFFCDKDH